MDRDELLAVEPGLLERAGELMGRLPFDLLDVLVVGEIGKNYSGAGIDPNVVGRLLIEAAPELEPARPRITRMCALDVSPESHGNATGVGIADLTTNRLLAAIDQVPFRMNNLTACFLWRSKLPLAFPTDAECIATAIETCWQPIPAKLKFAVIPNTLEVAEMWVSGPLAEEAGEPGVAGGGRAAAAAVRRERESGAGGAVPSQREGAAKFGGRAVGRVERSASDALTRRHRRRTREDFARIAPATVGQRVAGAPFDPPYGTEPDAIRSHRYRQGQVPMPFPQFDRSRLALQPLARRTHDLDLATCLLPLDGPPEPFDHADVAAIADRLVAAKARRIGPRTYDGCPRPAGRYATAFHRPDGARARHPHRHERGRADPRLGIRPDRRQRPRASPATSAPASSACGKKRGG